MEKKNLSGQPKSVEVKSLVFLFDSLSIPPSPDGSPSCIAVGVEVADHSAQRNPVLLSRGTGQTDPRTVKSEGEIPVVVFFSLKSFCFASWSGPRQEAADVVSRETLFFSQRIDKRDP